MKNYSQFVSFPIYTWQEKSRTVEVGLAVSLGYTGPLGLLPYVAFFILLH